MDILGVRGASIALLIICGITAVISQDSCHVEPTYRRECGYIGIKPETCLARDCCFDSSIWGAKWCFRKRTSNACDILPNDRRDCGWPGISRETCERKGCCYNSNVLFARWCFYKRD